MTQTTAAIIQVEQQRGNANLPAELIVRISKREGTITLKHVLYSWKSCLQL